MTRGRFIALEGGEGAGKSTQARLLVERLQAAGQPAVLTREPGGTPGAEAIRHLLLDPMGPGWGMKAEALLFAAARADHVERLILPALEAGNWVVCDRFIDSNRAYQGGGGGLEDAELLALHRFGADGLMPDLALLIELDSTEGAARLAQRDNGESDRIGGRDETFHQGVRDRFADIASKEMTRFARIDGSGTSAIVADRVWAAVEPLLGDAN